MPDDLIDVLLELRDVGLERLPEAGDPGASRGRAALDRAVAGERSRRWRPRPRALMTGRIRIGGFAVPPLAALGAIAATAAAATGGAVFAAHVTTKPSAKLTTIFERNPADPHVRHTDHGWIALFRKETVIPASVHERASVSVPHYGRVQFWAATTRQGGFCYALRLPDGSWAGYPFSERPTEGFEDGVVPGCIDTEQQRSIGELGRPSVEAPTATEGFSGQFKTRVGKIWELLFGYVTTQRYAAVVRDPVTGRTAGVTSGGYFLLAEPSTTNSAADELEVFDAAGRPLQPDYTRSGLLPGYRMGPTKGVG